MPALERWTWLCQKLAETQQNLPVPLTVEERNQLRALGKFLMVLSWAQQRAAVITNGEGS